MSELIYKCTSRWVVRRALLQALVVGPVLTAINHGGAILRMELDGARVLAIGLTLVVPYLISTISIVSAMNRSTLDPSQKRADMWARGTSCDQTVSASCGE